MRKVEEIERQIRELPPTEFAELCRWIEELEAARWDAEIERDARAGALDDMIDDALADHRAGRSRPL